jgi:hypothetical protein
MEVSWVMSERRAGRRWKGGLGMRGVDSGGDEGEAMGEVFGRC